MNHATKQFIVDNFDQDVTQLAFQSARYPLVDMPFAIRQIAGRQKIKTKIPHFHACESIHYPAQLSIEQSSSESTALYKSTLCEGNILVDLTGGFGVDCYFMSAHFLKVSYVEKQKELCELANHNFKALGANHIEINHEDSVVYLDKMTPVDWMYIDPSRRNINGQKIILISDCIPNVTALYPKLVTKCKHLMVKLSPMMDLSATIAELPQTNELHIIAVNNECKEILLLLHSHTTSTLKIKTVNLKANNCTQQFEFEIKEEESATSFYTSKLGNYLYEPNAAILKSGAFKFIGNKYELFKLHKSTHLYTSDDLKTDFPGRIFSINKQWNDGKDEWKKEAKRIQKANLSIRNYPSSVEELRRKIKLADGGDTYLFACTVSNEKKIMIECSKIST